MKAIVSEKGFIRLTWGDYTRIYFFIMNCWGRVVFYYVTAWIRHNSVVCTVTEPVLACLCRVIWYDVLISLGRDATTGNLILPNIKIICVVLNGHDHENAFLEAMVKNIVNGPILSYGDCTYYVDNFHHNLCCLPTYCLSQSPRCSWLQINWNQVICIKNNKRKINVYNVVDMKSCWQTSNLNAS